MKTFLMAIAVLLFTGCAPESPTKLLYSSEFKISLPDHYVKSATIFYSDGVSIKTHDGKLFSGQLVWNETEKLPENFDIRIYPELIFGIRDKKDLSPELSLLISESAINITKSMSLKNLKNLKIKKNGVFTIYSICNTNECIAFVVKDSFKEHIFYAYSQKIYEAEFINLLSGGLNVNK